jgi:hypothetical protein
MPRQGLCFAALIYSDGLRGTVGCRSSVSPGKPNQHSATAIPSLLPRRAEWLGRTSGYDKRNRVEPAIGRYKQVIGDGLPDRAQGPGGGFGSHFGPRLIRPPRLGPDGAIALALARRLLLRHRAHRPELRGNTNQPSLGVSQPTYRPIPCLVEESAP